MLTRTLRHSRSAPTLRALSPGPPSAGQIAHIHSTPVAAAKAAQSTAGGPLAAGWRERTVVELKAELKRRGLPTSGRKEELVMRLTNANANFGTAEALGATSSVSPTKALKMKKSMPSLKSSGTNSAFTTPVKAPPVPKIPEIYAAPTVAPILKAPPQYLTTSMANLRIGGSMPSTPLNPALINKPSFSNLRAASTLTPTKSSSPGPNPKASRTPLRRQSNVQNLQATPPPPFNLPQTQQQQQRRKSTIAPASQILPKLKSPPKQRTLHTTAPFQAMLQDNVVLPTFTAESVIEIPPVPIVPDMNRKPPPFQFESPAVETPIITTAGAYTHAAPPGGGSSPTKEHLQSDSTKPRTGAKSQEGRFEGDWSEEGGEGYKFEPEQGEIPVQDKGILWGIVGAATLWGVFGPKRKNHD